MSYDDTTIKISDLDIRTTSPTALVTFVEHFQNIKSRWRPNTCGEQIELILNICADI
jgi:hypothetical protein